MFELYQLCVCDYKDKQKNLEPYLHFDMCLFVYRESTLHQAFRKKWV